MSCVVCLTDSATITLHPCNHTPVCPTCAPKLTSPLCPLCRETITTLHIPTCTPPIVYFPKLQALRAAHDVQNRDAVAQIVITAPANTAEAAKALLTRIIYLFKPLTSPQVTISGLPYTSPYSANTIVNKIPARFSFVQIPRTTPYSAVHQVRDLKPDFLLITSPLHDRSAMPHLLSLDASLRAFETNPLRMWLFLDRRSDSWKSNSNLYFHEDISNAFATMPECARPLTYHVLPPILRPKARGLFSSGASRIRKIVGRSVFHATKKRALASTLPFSVLPAPHGSPVSVAPASNAMYHV